jgi:lipooligosaccharide transport system permease protein
MFLFSGTFFPLEQLPAWARTIAYCFPLTHIVELCRPAALGVYKTAQWWGLLYLSLFSLIATPLALVLMRRRLIS